MIRPATPEDAPAIADIWNQIIRDSIATFTTAEKRVPDLASQIRTQPYFVALSGGEIRGFATYFQFRGGPGYAHTMEHTVHLAPAARGAGLGRGLMLAVETHAREAGVHSLFAGISGENAAGIAFHARLGYVQAARLPQVGRKFDRWHDLVLMQKFL